MIVIISNGGGNPQPIEALFAMLAEHPLDRRFEAYGNFIEARPCHGVAQQNHLGNTIYEDGEPLYPDCPGTVRFFGNFLTYSHVFSIDTDEPELIARLTAAIRANQQRTDYLAQERPKGSTATEASQAQAAEPPKPGEQLVIGFGP